MTPEVAEVVRARRRQDRARAWNDGWGWGFLWGVLVAELVAVAALSGGLRG